MQIERAFVIFSGALFCNSFSAEDNLSFNLTLSHSEPLASVPSYLTAELTGDLATAAAPHHFNSHYLVVPDKYWNADGVRAHHERIKAWPDHLQYAMMLDRSFFDLSGKSCNKIGVAPFAFKYDQPQPCTVVFPVQQFSIELQEVRSIREQKICGHEPPIIEFETKK